MVEIKNLLKRFGSITAVNDITFTVADNEILGFLGPNGAGKSTTMNMITGCLPPSRGTVVVNGFDISKNPMEAKKCIGYLPEIPPLYTDMKVYEYLKFVAGIKAVPKAQRVEQIRYAMDKLKIADVSKRVIKNLSKGYKQRVGFAQALLGNPSILILDEPTVGLDPNQILEVRDLIKELKKEHTIILSSHVLQEITAVCEKVLIINKGEMRAFDSISNLVEENGSLPILSVTVSGDIQKVSAIIRSCSGVKEIKEILPSGNDSNSYKIEISNDESKREIMSRLISENFEISSVQTEQPSLEDIFVKLTHQPLKKKSIHDVFNAIEQDMDSSDKTKDKEDGQ